MSHKLTTQFITDKGKGLSVETLPSHIVGIGDAYGFYSEKNVFKCGSCGAMGPHADIPSEAIEFWNTRHTPWQPIGTAKRHKDMPSVDLSVQ
jgi:hypothetical protein